MDACINRFVGCWELTFNICAIYYSDTHKMLEHGIIEFIRAMNGGIYTSTLGDDPSHDWYGTILGLVSSNINLMFETYAGWIWCWEIDMTLLSVD